MTKYNEITPVEAYERYLNGEKTFKKYPYEEDYKDLVFEDLHVAFIGLFRTEFYKEEK